MRKVHGTTAPLFADEAPAPEGSGKLPAVRSRGRRRDNAVHAVRPEELGEVEGPRPKPWRLRTRDECIAKGIHVLERDAFIGLTYCFWCGYPE
jgi:hypothetical protein